MTTIETISTNGSKPTSKKAGKEPEVELGTPDAPALTIRSIETRTIRVPIKGTNALIVHNFSAKSKTQMLDAQQGRKNAKEARDPNADYEASFYRLDNPAEFGFPVLAFKAATVGAARYFKSVPMTVLRAALFFNGLTSANDPQLLVKITGTPEMREDVVRLSGPSRSADLRYRAAFPEWSAELEIKFVRNMLDEESVLALVNAGGFGIGVGEWRPERKGEYGTYTVDSEKDVVIVNG